MKKSRARRWTGSVLGTIVETPLARRLNTTSDVMVPNEASRETLNRIRHEGNETLLPAWVSPAVRLIEHAGRNHTSGSEINRRMSVIMYDIATEIGAELFAMSASVVRARMLGTDEAIELADLFCRNARLRVEQLFHGLSHHEDDHNYRAAQRALEGRYRFMEQGILDPADLMERGVLQLEEAPAEGDPVLAG
jgi:hypothetical protein